jgi:hypothetical protein
MTPTPDEQWINSLSINEKLELIARIWESMPPDAVPEMPASHLEDLKRRLARPAAVNEALDRNWRVACAINEEALRDPQSPYFLKCVGLVNGQVVAVTDDQDELTVRLQEIECEPWLALCFVAGANPTPAEEV